jgi:iron complex outermembrane receptor protein
LLDGYKVFNTSSIDTESYAAFGQATWNIRDDLRLTGGLRYTQEGKRGVFAATTAGGLATSDPVLIARRNGVARAQAYAAEIDDGVLTGQASISYDVSRDVLVYASYARGSKSGGINMAGIRTPRTDARPDQRRGRSRDGHHLRGRREVTAVRPQADRQPRSLCYQH